MPRSAGRICVGMSASLPDAMIWRTCNPTRLADSAGGDTMIRRTPHAAPRRGAWRMGVWDIIAFWICNGFGNPSRSIRIGVCHDPLRGPGLRGGVVLPRPRPGPAGATTPIRRPDWHVTVGGWDDVTPSGGGGMGPNDGGPAPRWWGAGPRIIAVGSYLSSM